MLYFLKTSSHWEYVGLNQESSKFLGERNGLLSVEEICMVEPYPHASTRSSCSPYQERWDPYDQTQMCEWKELPEGALD